MKEKKRNIKKPKKKILDEEEDNDCETLIRYHKNVGTCSLLTEGYHTVKQMYYFCSCDPDCQQPLCLACIKYCHAEHWQKRKLTDLIKDKRAAFCSCGIRNHILSENMIKSDFNYDEQCLFLEWSTITKTYIFYEDANQPDEILCMFCYNLCKKKPETYVRKCDDVLCHRLRCSDKHGDFLSVFEKFSELTKEKSFKFESFCGIQFLNMVLMSESSFDNSFHRLLNSLNSLKNDLLNKKKKLFDFVTYINNSPFMKALDTINNILNVCKSMFYTTSIIDVSKFIFPLLQRKFNYKSQENVWILKRNLFDIYHVITFRRDFEVLPMLSVEDLPNFNPFQRLFCAEYINLFPEINKNYFELKEKETYQKNHVDELLRTIEKYKSIKNRNEYTYDILSTIYSELKKILRFNKLSNEQLMKFFALNDDIIFTALDEKSFRIKCGFSQMRMIYQMIKCITFISYYYNDINLLKYFKGTLEINHLSFFHGNNEVAKMVYKNTTHILLYCRTLHQNYVIEKKNEEEATSQQDKLNLSGNNNVNILKMRETIDKLNNKILFMSTEIMSLSLIQNDPYYLGLNRLLEPNMEIYSSIFSGVYTPKEQEIITTLTKICIEIETVYHNFFSFEIKNYEIEKCITNKIRQIFSLLGQENETLKHNKTMIIEEASKRSNIERKKTEFENKQDNTNNNLNKSQKDIMNFKTEKEREDYNKKIKLLINKTPILFTIVKSLEVLSTMNNRVQGLGQTYINALLSFINYYVQDCCENCLFIISSKILKPLLKLNIAHLENLPQFIELLYYMIKTISDSNVILRQNDLIIKLIENIFWKINNNSEFLPQMEILLKTIGKLSKMKYLHQEYAMNEIRNSLKSIYNNTTIFVSFRNMLISKKDLNDIKNNILVNNQKNEDEESADNDDLIDKIPMLFTHFLKLINYMFDGNSTLNEEQFLSSIFNKEQIAEILQDLNLNLSLRTEIIRFYRILYMDIMIDPKKMNEYLKIFAQDIKPSIEQSSTNYILLHELIKVKNNNFDVDLHSKILSFELDNYKTIFKNNEQISKKEILKYFKKSLVMPLYVFMNICIAMVFTFNGVQYIKFYELVFDYLLVKKKIMQNLGEIGKDVEKNNQTKQEEKNNENKEIISKSYILYLKLKNENIQEVIDDMKKLKSEEFNILDYKLIYDLFVKHSDNYIDYHNRENLEEIFSKKTNTSAEEEIKKRKEEFQSKGKKLDTYTEKIFKILLKYKKDKNNFSESSISQNLSEKNILYDTSYRQIMLRPLMYLINNENLYLKYRRQNIFQIYRLLQYDTRNTQRDILEMKKGDEQIIMKKLGIDNKSQKKIDNSLLRKASIIFRKDKDSSDLGLSKKKINVIKDLNLDIEDINIETNQLFIDFDNIINIFLENLLSIMLTSCNPTTISFNEDYRFAYLLMKVFKYMCEEHNIKFQTIFFKEVKLEAGTTNLNLFDLMMCTLDKILILAKWDQVNYDSNETKTKYFYDIFNCMIELSIEMVQGTTKKNSMCIISQEHKNERSYFYRFLVQARGVLRNNNNDSKIIYNVRTSIISFLQAFIEEKNTPPKIKIILENLFSPMSIFESIINILKKLFLKSIDEDIKNANKIDFDQDICKFFIDKYFSDSEFSKKKEFLLANYMYHYVKCLSNYKNKDAVSIIECTKNFTEEKILSLKDKRYDDDTNNDEENESVLINPRYYQIYFVEKFFEAITRGVWIQGEDENNPQYVLFTLEPTVLYLSQNSKNNFINNVSRDSRSSKLFSLMEHANYFYIEINQNSKKLENKGFWRLLNKINYDMLDIFIFVITLVINIVIFVTSDSIENANDYIDIYKYTLPIGIIQTAITFLALLIWTLSKFSLTFTLEKEKYYLSHRINKEEQLSIGQYIDVIIFKTILSRREIVNFIWDLIFSVIGIINSRYLFVYSIQILIIVNINSTLQNITKAIVLRYKQLIIFILFLLLAAYIFSTIAFNLLQKEFIHENEGNQENACGSLFICFLSHLEFGIRTDGGIGEYTRKLAFKDNESYFMGMFFFQFIFYIFMIVIMLAVIGGSVIDTFAELRDKSREALNDLNNICFICNGTRDQIEKGGEVFEEHTENVHNIWNYVDYMIGLKFVDPQDTNAINTFVINQIQNKKISWFPSFVERDDYQQQDDFGEDENGENKDDTNLAN